MDETDILTENINYLKGIKDCILKKLDVINVNINRLLIDSQIIKNKYESNTHTLNLTENNINVKCHGKIKIKKIDYPKFLAIDNVANVKHDNTNHLSKIYDNCVFQRSRTTYNEGVEYTTYSSINKKDYVVSNFTDVYKTNRTISMNIVEGAGGIPMCFYNSRFYSDKKYKTFLDLCLFEITPVYQYSNYDADIEINEIYKRRHRLKCNVHFVKMFMNITLLNDDDIISVKIKNNYKLLKDILEEEYENIECIIINNEPKFRENILLKYIEDDLEIFEIM